MEQVMRETTILGRRMVQENSHGRMGVCTLGSFLIIISTVEESMNGLMVEFTRAIGGTTRWKVTVHSLGQTGGDMWGSILMI
jgi:hypothetical protein